jgi:hypothetical protein
MGVNENGHRTVIADQNGFFEFRGLDSADSYRLETIDYFLRRYREGIIERHKKERGTMIHRPCDHR